MFFGQRQALNAQIYRLVVYPVLAEITAVDGDPTSDLEHFLALARRQKFATSRCSVLPPTFIDCIEHFPTAAFEWNAVGADRVRIPVTSHIGCFGHFVWRSFEWVRTVEGNTRAHFELSESV